MLLQKSFHLNGCLTHGTNLSNFDLPCYERIAFLQATVDTVSLETVFTTDLYLVSGLGVMVRALN